MKKAQDVPSLKKRLDASLSKQNQKKSSVKENYVNPQKVLPAKKQKTASIEVYLDVPSYKSPTCLNDSKSTSVLADIGNNLKSPPFLATQSFTQQSDDYTVQCTDLARVHYVRQTLSKCLYALLTNREESIQVSKEKSFTQRNKQRSQLIQISKVLNSTGQLINDAEIDPRVLHLSTDSDKCLTSDDNDLIANKYNSASLFLRAFISWKRYHYLKKVKRAKKCSVIVEKSHENSSKNITINEGYTSVKDDTKPIHKSKQDSTIQSYQTKIEAPASRDPLQNLSRKLTNKQIKPINENLESVEDVALESQNNISIQKLRQSHISYNQSAQFTDDSYLQILGLPFSYNDRLKLKAFTGLRGYLDLQMTRGTIYRKISLLQKAFKSLVYSFQQQRYDSIRSRLQQILRRKSLKTCFEGFKSYMLQEQTIRKFQERSQRKSAQSVISVFSGNLSQNSEVYRRLELLKKKQCFSNIRMFCLESRIQRVGSVQSYEKMRLFWKRRVLKVLFNQVKVAKRVEMLRVISARMNDSQILRHFLKTWQVKSQITEFKHKNYNRFLKKFFEPWLRESIRRVHAKQSFLIKRARNINSRTMQILKLYTQQCLDKKQRVLSLFQLRAANLQRLAFREGLLEFHRQARLKKNLNLVAGIFQAQRLYKDTLKQFKAYIQLKRLGKQTQQKHSYIIGLNTLQQWAIHAQHSRKLRKLKHKKETKSKYFVIQRLKKLIAMRKFKRAKLNLVIALRGKKLLKISIVSFKKEMVRVQNQIDSVMRLIKTKAQQTRKAVLQGLVEHRINSLRKKLVVAETKNRTSLRVKFQIFTAFMLNQVLQKKVKNSLPFQLKLNKKMLENTFTFLRLYSIRKTNQRLCITSMREIRNSRIYSQVLDVLVNYTKDHKKMSQLKQKALQKRRFELSKKTMQAIFLWRLNKAQEAQLTLGICSQRRQHIFSRWFKYVHDELPKIKLAKIHYLKSRFISMKKYVKSMSQPRIHRRRISGITAQNVTHHYINQAIYWLYLHSQAKIHQRSKIQLSDRIWKSRLFQKWVGVMPYLKRMNKNNNKALKFRNRNLVQKGMEMLYVFSQIKINQAQIVAVFRQRERARIQSLCLASMIDFASETKLRVLGFVELMCPVIQRSKALAFKKWMTAHASMLKIEMADQLYLQRNGKEKKKLIWQQLRHETDKRITKKRKNHKISQHYRHFAMRAVFNRLILRRNMKLHEQLCISRIAVKSSKRCKKGVFAALKNYWQISFERRQSRKKLDKIRRGRILRTALNALLLNNTIAQKGALTRIKISNRLVVYTLDKWRKAFQFSNKISNMVTIVQHHMDKSFVRSVLPAILRYGNIRKLSESLNQRRNDRLLRCVMTSFVNQIMVKKILKALVIQSRQARMAKVFKEFRRQTRMLIIHRELIATQVDLQNQEEQTATKRAVFGELTQLRFRRRANDCARHKFVFALLKNTFYALRQITLKEKTLKCNFKLHQNEKIGKYLALWIAAKELHHREKSAHRVLGFSIKNKVFRSLKDHKDRMHAIKEFKKVWAVKRLQFLGLRGFQQHNNIQKFQNYVLMRISSKHNSVIQRDALQLFLQGCKQSRLERSLLTYHNNRIASQVIQSWRAQVRLSNKVRLNLIKLRSSLRSNPSLGKPLLVLRNTLLNKAFQSLKEKAQRLRFLRKQARLSTYAFYLRLLRKAFYGLRLNAADQYQNQKSRQIKRLVIKRRWFDKLKTAIANQKEARVKASHAAIFRFLSLQRKALKSIVIYFTQRCRLKIQNNFAMTLYYKNLLTKGYLSIKLYLIANRQSRRAPPSIVIQEDLPENEYDDADRQHSDRSYQNMKFEQIRVKQNAQQDSRNTHQFNAEDVTLAPYSKTFMANAPDKSFKTPPNEISTLSNEFVISSTEMGPISSINYLKLKNLPQTMLQDQKKQSMSSSIIVDEVPSCISATPPMSSPPTSNKQL